MFNRFLHNESPNTLREPIISEFVVLTSVGLNCFKPTLLVRAGGPPSSATIFCRVFRGQQNSIIGLTTKVDRPPALLLLLARPRDS
jgi:hypothetical protein